MSTTATVKGIEVELLAKDLERQAEKCEALQTDRALDAGIRRVLAMQARTLHACAADMRDLLTDLPHPAKRRALQLPLREVARG